MLGGTASIAISLAGLAGISLNHGQPRRAAQLLGAAQAVLAHSPAAVQPADRIDFEREFAVVRKQLGEETFASIRDKGRAMTLDQAIAYALTDSFPEQSAAAV